VHSPLLFVFPDLDDKTVMTRGTVLKVMGLFLFAHFAALFLFPQSPGVSALFPLACCLSAVAACHLRSTRCSGPVRRKWDFVASALSLWSIGVVIYALRSWASVLGHISALGPEFYFLIYGIPVLLAISTSNEDPTRPSLW